MSDENNKELLIKITTLADTAGVDEQVAAQTKLEISTSKTANAINAALAGQEQKERTANDETRSVRQEQAQSALRQIEAHEKLKAAGEHAAEGINHLSHETKELSHLGHEASGVMEGLARGDMAGLAQAGSNAARIFKTLATSSLGAPLLAALSAAAAAMYALKVIVRDAEKEIERETEKGNASVKRKKELLEATARVAEISLQKEEKAVEKLTATWNDLDAAVERAHKRTEQADAAKRDDTDAKTNLAEQQALAKAKTPDEKEAIQRRIAGQRNDQKNKNAADAIEQDQGCQTRRRGNHQQF